MHTLDAMFSSGEAIRAAGSSTGGSGICTIGPEGADLVSVCESVVGTDCGVVACGSSGWLTGRPFVCAAGRVNATSDWHAPAAAKRSRYDESIAVAMVGV